MNRIEEKDMKIVRGPLICVILINLQLGLSYSWSVFSQVLIEQEGWAYSEAVLPSTIASFAYALSMLAFGLFLERYGPKKTVQIGAVLMISGLLLASVFMEPLGVVIGFGVFYGCAAGACFSATQAITLRWLAGSGSTVGITSAAFGISSVLLSVVANWLLEEIGIKLTIGGIGVVSGICIFMIGTLLHLPALDSVPRTEQNRVISEKDLDCRGMIRKKNVLLSAGHIYFRHSSSDCSKQPYHHDRLTPRRLRRGLSLRKSDIIVRLSRKTIGWFTQ